MKISRLLRSTFALCLWFALAAGTPAFGQITYTTIDIPGSTRTRVTGIFGSNVVGFYTTGNRDAEVYHGYLFDGSTYTNIAYPGAVGTIPTGISGSYTIGYYSDAGGGTHGFLFNGSTYTSIDAPIGIMPNAVSGNNVVGNDGGTWGFLFDGANYTLMQPPGSQYSQAWGVSGRNVVGSYYGATRNYGYLFNGSTYLTLDPPGSIGGTGASAVDGNTVGGTYQASESVYHGFLFDGSNYTIFDFPGSLFTYPTGIVGSTVVGSYSYDSYDVVHGFLFDGSRFSTIDPPGSIWTSPAGISGNKIYGFYQQVAGKDLGFIASLPMASTAQQQIQAVQTALAALVPTGTNKTDSQINKAIDRIINGLNPAYYIDGSHLASNGGKAFDEIKAGIVELMAIKNPPAGVLSAISSLLAAMQALAQVAIDDAVAKGGKPNEIAAARSEMTKAMTELGNGKFDHEMDHYKSAWQHALKA